MAALLTKSLCTTKNPASAGFFFCLAGMDEMPCR
jgi:hypothetical protein